MDLGGDFYIYTLTENGKGRRLASPLPEEVVIKQGLVSEALAGEFKGAEQSTSPEDFETNPVFVKFLQWSIAKHIRDCPEFIEEAKQRGNGSLLVVDVRALPITGKDTVKDEDLIGVVQVKDGKAETFSGFARYQPYTSKGFTQLVPSLQQKYMQELRELADTQKA